MFCRIVMYIAQQVPYTDARCAATQHSRLFMVVSAHCECVLIAWARAHRSSQAGMN